MILNILFIGNSHTYLHYMPRMLVQLIAAGDCGFEIEADQSVGEGVSLEWHWNHAPTRQKMCSRKWSYIVLQDRSGGPLENPESFQRHARLLDAEVKKLGAVTVLYMTWANRTRPDTQMLLTDAYTRVADKLEATLAPVGAAWERARRNHSNLELHHRDGRHASPVGAYLTACVFYSLLTGNSPEGLPAKLFIEGKFRPDQDREQAMLLQKTAWETVSKSDPSSSDKTELWRG